MAQNFFVPVTVGPKVPRALARIRLMSATYDQSAWCEEMTQQRAKTVEAELKCDL